MSQQGNQNPSTGTTGNTVNVGGKKIGSKDLERLCQIGFLSFSNSGYLPSGAWWILTESQLEQLIMRISRQFIDDVKTVSIIPDRRSGQIHAYVCLSKKSKHLVSNELMNEDYAIRKPLKSMSPQLKEFIQKFGYPDRRMLVDGSSGPGSEKLVGLEVIISRFIKIEFDDSGAEYGKIYGDQFRRRSRLMITPVFEELKKDTGNGDRYGKFEHLIIHNEISDGNRKPNKWYPNKSYNAR